MSDTTRTPFTANGNDTVDIAAQARSLRRKLLFWRRVLLFVVGVAIIVVLVAWQRTTIRMRECAQALQHYAELAKASTLELGPPEAFEAQWQRLPKDRLSVSASHYSPLVQNWVRRAGPGEALPLAVCRDSHVVFLTRGRHVLYRDDQRDYVKWISEEQAEDILKGIRSDSP